MTPTTKQICEQFIRKFDEMVITMSREDYEESVDVIGSHFAGLADCIREENEVE